MYFVEALLPIKFICGKKMVQLDQNTVSPIVTGSYKDLWSHFYLKSLKNTLPFLQITEIETIRTDRHSNIAISVMQQYWFQVTTPTTIITTITFKHLDWNHQEQQEHL